MIEVTESSLVCDKGYCLCSEWQKPDLRTIYGTVTYLVGYEAVERKLELSVPADLDRQIGISCALVGAATKLALSEGAKEGCVTFLSDGSRRLRSLRECWADLRFTLRGRGVPVTRRIKFSLR